MSKTQEALRVERALNLALEALREIESLPGISSANLYARRALKAIEALVAVPEAHKQPAQQQEPVAQEWRYYFSHSGATGKPDEVVGPCFTDKKEVAFGVGCFDQTALCPPASKPWVGLTDEEIHKMTVLMGINPEWKAEMEIVRSVVRNLEAKLKEKNA